MMDNNKLDELISEWLDGRINEERSELLQGRLRESQEARARFRRLSSLDATLRAMASGDDDFSPLSSCVVRSDRKAYQANASSALGRRWAFWVIGASLLACVGALAYEVGKERGIAKVKFPSPVRRVVGPAKEKMVSGHATLRRAAGIKWSDGAKGYREGDVLPAGVFEFGEGVAEIDFFCGATVVVEGPARLDLESDWVVRLHKGRIRVNVPPAAQGFAVKAADSEVIDLGTEFAMEVDADNVRVAVVDGEIKLKGGLHDGLHMTAGQERLLKGADSDSKFVAGLSTIGDIAKLHDAGQKRRRAEWLEFAKKLREDDRLVAFYSMENGRRADRMVANLAESGDQLDGKLVGAVTQAEGRFGDQSSSLEFDRLGSRVRAKIDGEFKAFTFACWAKVDGLDHRYNALLMGDGYEDGEPHWQIRDDGKLMLSVMVDAAPSVRENVDVDGNWHYVYLTPVIWDDSAKGRWMHIVSVFDPEAKVVRQYVNGEEVCREEIRPEYFVDSLRIGAAEIGNWGQPFRDSPGFAVRNLNGAIDEMLIYKAALSPSEVVELFENGKPFGY